MKKNFKYYRLNYQITAPKLRLLDETGKQIGVFDRNEALRKAQSENKDLVEIAAKANPSVVKLIDFKKFKYLEAKKAREARKNIKHVDIKEIRLSPFIGAHDFKIRINQAEEFLNEGNSLKISIPFKGREITHKEFGHEIMNKALNYLQKSSKVTKNPYMEGRVLVSFLVPAKRVSKSENAKNQD